MQRRTLLASIAGALALPAAAALATAGWTAQTTARQLLLSVDFAPRQVAQVEVGYFRFEPGQLAPVHTHAAPAIGVVARGTVLYQVEGQPMQVLKPGDGFYEPVGPRILHFDNASATEEAVFIDFNLEQQGEPFIVFPQPPTERIDRRSLPTYPLGGVTVTHAEAHAETLGTNRVAPRAQAQPVVGYVLEGSVTLQVAGQPVQRIGQGGSFHRPAGVASTLVASAGRAKVISFELR